MEIIENKFGLHKNVIVMCCFFAGILGFFAFWIAILVVVIVYKF